MGYKNLCSRFSSLCPIPPAVPLNLTNWFAKPKPNPLPPPKQPSGERLKVLHISDIHIDPSAYALFLSVSRSIWTLTTCCIHLQDTQQEPKRTVLRACVVAITPTIHTLLIRSCSLLHVMAHTPGNLFIPCFFSGFTEMWDSTVTLRSR